MFSPIGPSRFGANPPVQRKTTAARFGNQQAQPAPQEKSVSLYSSDPFTYYGVKGHHEGMKEMVKLLKANQLLVQPDFETFYSKLDNIQAPYHLGNKALKPLSSPDIEGTMKEVYQGMNILGAKDKDVLQTAKLYLNKATVELLTQKQAWSSQAVVADLFKAILLVGSGVGSSVQDWEDRLIDAFTKPAKAAIPEMLGLLNEISSRAVENGLDEIKPTVQVQLGAVKVPLYVVKEPKLPNTFNLGGMSFQIIDLSSLFGSKGAPGKES